MMPSINAASFDVSIIIVNYKTPGLILDCLKTVFQFTKGVSFEVLLIDNDSGDDSEARIRAAYPAERFPNVRWFQTGYNSGFSRANNLGIDHARGRYIFLQNSDTLLLDDLLTRLVAVMDARPDVAGLCPMQITRDGTVHHAIYHAFSQLRRHFFIFPHNAFTLKLIHWLIPDPVYSEPEQVQWLSGACLMTRPAVIAQVGKLEERFFMYGEDSEWSYRLGKAGRLLMLRDAFIVHLEYGSSSEYQQRETLSHINRFRTQMHVSNLLWLRMQYGIGAYLVVMLHYLTLIPAIFGWKIAVNLRNGQSPLTQLDNQRAFARQVGVFLRFFWPTLLKKKMFYKV